MVTVWKFVFTDPSWNQRMLIPKGATFRMFGLQESSLCIWFEVDVAAPVVDRWFEVMGTGFEVPENSEWLASVNVFRNSAWWAWHLYEHIQN